MVEIREAREGDTEDVAAFTRETWRDRDYDDYMPEVFPRWVEADDPDRRTIVADADGEAVGTLQTVLLSEYEAWQQGMRVHPDHRGEGIARRLTRAGFEWVRDRGATVARNMVFSWNAMGLGLSRSVGFEAATEFRRANPEPDADASAPETVADPDAAWAFWTANDAREHLRGLAFDPEESWAVSELTRDRLADAADDGGLLVIEDDGVTGFTYRNRIDEREDETWAEYGVAVWADPRACETLFEAITADAASVGADRTRVLIPETVEAVSDAALAGVELSEEADFVLAADLARF